MIGDGILVIGRNIPHTAAIVLTWVQLCQTSKVGRLLTCEWVDEGVSVSHV